MTEDGGQPFDFYYFLGVLCDLRGDPDGRFLLRISNSRTKNRRMMK
jgi:hypothetical protein